MSAAVTLPDWDGLKLDLPEHEYHRRILGVVSKGAIVKFAKTPLHYKAWIDGKAEDEETDALRFGRAFHCAVLEPERFARAYVAEPAWGDCRKTENKTRRDAWRALNGGKAIIDADDERRIIGMRSALRAHPLVSKMLAEGEAEVSAYWTDPETGLRCRARADFFSRAHRMIADVKSTADASPEAFRRDVFKYRYDWQHVLYRAGFAALGERVEHFVFIAVEKEPPYAVATYTLDSLGVSLAFDRVRMQMRRLADCLSRNEWPGYDAGIQTIETPPWAS